MRTLHSACTPLRMLLGEWPGTVAKLILFGIWKRPQLVLHIMQIHACNLLVHQPLTCTASLKFAHMLRPCCQLSVSSCRKLSSCANNFRKLLDCPDYRSSSVAGPWGSMAASRGWQMGRWILLLQLLAAAPAAWGQRPRWELGGGQGPGGAAAQPAPNAEGVAAGSPTSSPAAGALPAGAAPAGSPALAAVPPPAAPLPEPAAPSEAPAAALSDGAGACGCSRDAMSGAASTSAVGCGQWLAEARSGQFVCYVQASAGGDGNAHACPVACLHSQPVCSPHDVI